MGVVICSFPDEPNPRELLARFESILHPFVLQILEKDVYEKKLAKVKEMIEKAGLDKEHFPVWQSIQRDVASFAPMIRFSIEIEGNPRVRATISRKSLSVICDDPIPVNLLNRVAEFARTIRGAALLVQDSAGNPVPFVVHPPS
jgi:hypothetical protein